MTSRSPTSVPVTLSLERVGQIGGVSKAVAVQGRHAYLNVGPRLLVLDVVDPAHPIPVGQSPVLPGFEGLAVSGDFAYVAAGAGGLLVMDVSNPAAPTEVGLYAMPGPAWNIALAGNLAYVAAQDGLHILDISNPAVPTGIGLYRSPDAALDVTVMGNIAYVAEAFSRGEQSTERGGLRVVDVADPTSPYEIGFFPMNPNQVDEFQRPNAPRGAQAVAVLGDHAYLTYRTERRGGLRVLDISDRANPLQVGDWQDYVYYISDLTVVTGSSTDPERIFVYAATGVNFGLVVVDVTDPAQPVALAGEVPGPARGISVAGNALFVADEFGGLHVADISNRARPVEIGFYNTLGDARDVVISGGTAYVTDGLRDLWVVDVSDPAQPAQAGVYTAPGSLQGVAVAGTTLYIAAETAGLLAVDVSNPMQPVQVGAYDTPGLVYGVALAGDYAYIVDGQLQLLNIADPATAIAVYDNAERIEDLVIADNMAYLTTSGLNILDISDPAHPQEISLYATSSKSWDLAVMGDRVYLIVDGALHIVDVSNPAHPLGLGELGFADVPDYGGHVAVRGDYAYVVGESRVHVIDVSELAKPREVLSFDVPGKVNGIAVARDYVYVAAGVDGLIILKLGGRR